MKDLQKISTQALSLIRSGKLVAIATITRTEGSTYRRTGTRMLIQPDGTFTGYISAGCLEADLFEKTKSTLKSGFPQVVSYDTSSDEDIVWGLGLGCNGHLDILIESVADPLVLSKLHAIDSFLSKEMSGFLVTAIRTDSTSIPLGSFMLVSHNSFPNGVGLTRLQSLIERDLGSTNKHSRPFLRSYKEGDIEVELLIEPLSPPIPLLIFGAGPDIRAVVSIAHSLGWNVSIIDKRSKEELAGQFPDVENFYQISVGSFPEDLPLTEQSVALVMTHNYLVDLEILKHLLLSPVDYIGLLGPKKRGEKILSALLEQEHSYRPEQLSRLHNPVGLDIGSETSEEIAISIVAEIMAVLSGRSGTFLKDKKTPIHDRT